MIAKVGISGLGTILEPVFILAIIIDNKVVKTKASFFVLWVVDTCRRNSLFGYSFNKSFDLGIFELVRIVIFITVISIKDIGPGSWSRTFSFLFLAVVATVFLFFFPSLLNDLFGILKGC